MSNRFRAPQSISELIPKALISLGVSSEMILEDVKRAWGEIVGKSIADKATPAELIKDILIIEVKSPVWSVEISLLKNDIIAKLNQKLGEHRIAELRFRAGGEIN
jgi:hypothetical protein